LGHINDVSKQKKLGLIYLDGHGDFNTNQTTLTGNIHGMALRLITQKSKNGLIKKERKLINEENTSLIGTKDLDLQEEIDLENSNVYVVKEEEFHKNFKNIVRKSLRRANKGTTGYHVSLDLDVIDPKITPGVSTPVKKGLTRKEIIKTMKMINTDKLTSIDFVESNPKYDKKDRTVKFVVELIMKLCK